MQNVTQKQPQVYKIPHHEGFYAIDHEDSESQVPIEWTRLQDYINAGGDLDALRNEALSNGDHALFASIDNDLP